MVLNINRIPFRFEKESNSTRTIGDDDNLAVVELNSPRKPPGEFEGIWKPTEARKMQSLAHKCYYLVDQP